MQNLNKNKEAFSLPEVIVAMFIFVLMMLVVTSVFVTMVKTRKEARDMQQRMENVRYAMELMAKNIRMSRVDDVDDSNLYIYNYSQGKCMHFKFGDSNVEMEEAVAESSQDCGSFGYSGSVNLAEGDIDGGEFYFFKPGADSSLGKVTILMKMMEGKENAQTTVALRNYSKIK